MEFLNMPYCGTADCICIYFVQDLLILCKEILATEDVLQQWVIFDKFKRQFLRSHGSRIKAASFKMCYSLLYDIDKFKGDDLSLSTLFVDLMAAIYLYHGGKIARHLIEDIQETHFVNDRETIRVLSAFRADSVFMKILLNFGYISSLKGESHQLRGETYQNIVHFM